MVVSPEAKQMASEAGVDLDPTARDVVASGIQSYLDNSEYLTNRGFRLVDYVETAVEDLRDPDHPIALPGSALAALEQMQTRIGPIRRGLNWSAT